MKKTILFTIIGLVLVVGVLGGIKFWQINRMIAVGQDFVPPPEPVTTADVRQENWESVIASTGSLTPVQGVTVSAELGGKVVEIPFEPGGFVQAGDLLLRQDTSSEEAQLRSAEAKASLARTNFERAKKLLPRNAMSQSEYDGFNAQDKEARAEVDRIRTTISKKTIRAPFAGRLGVRLANLGQILNEGEPIVSLQALDPIYVDFLLPQQELGRIETGLTVRVTTDALAGETIEGKITTINPQVDAATRNIKVQATVANPKERLRPGMFVNVAAVLPERKPILAIPATAVLYAPYSDSVFVVEEKENPKNGEPARIVRQQFVRLGESRGDFVAVESGLKPGETVVTTGVFKLRSGQNVVVDNTLSPEFKLNPEPEES